MRARGGILPLVVLALLLAGPAEGQRFDVELRAGASVGNYTSTLAGLELVPGSSLGALVNVDLIGDFGAYAGVTRSSFGCEEGLCVARDVSITTTGVIAGGRWSSGLLWARAGGAVQVLDVEALTPTAGEASETTDPAFGFDVAAGVELGVVGVLVRPGLVYRRHGASTDGTDAHAAVLAAEIGVAVPLGR